MRLEINEMKNERVQKYMHVHMVTKKLSRPFFVTPLGNNDFEV